MTQVFHGIPSNIPWNSMELWCRQMKYHLVPRNSMELWDCHFMACYPGLPRDIPWNSMELWSRQIKNHRVPWDSMELGSTISNDTNIPWNSMELWCRQMKSHLVPWNSMELWDCHFIQCHVTLDFHGRFPGIPTNSGVTKYKFTELIVACRLCVIYVREDNDSNV